MCCCEMCSRITALLLLLEDQLADVHSNDEFYFSQWDTTDRATLTTITRTYNEYEELLPKIKRNSSKCQANFLKSKKETLTLIEDAVIGDFGENISF